MNTNNTYLGYAIAIGEIVFASVGFITGWISTAEALGLLSVGLSTFGIHKSNVAVGKAVGSIRGY